MASEIMLTGVERTFDSSEIIVSKTDLKGHLTYVNNVFMRLASMSEKDCIGQPHNVIRHPEMPRCIFKLLWDSLQAHNELFAYVVNRSKNGDHYWVLAHVTPSRDASGNVVGYHSNRRVANRDSLTNSIIPLYKELLEEEAKHANRKDGMEASSQLINNLLSDKGMAYEEFIHTL